MRRHSIDDIPQGLRVPTLAQPQELLAVRAAEHHAAVTVQLEGADSFHVRGSLRGLLRRLGAHQNATSGTIPNSSARSSAAPHRYLTGLPWRYAYSISLRVDSPK